MNPQDVTTTAGALATTAGAMLIAFGLRALGAIAVWLVGRWLIGLVARLIGRALTRQHVDPTLIEAAGQDYPGPQWLVGDLAELDLPSRGITEPFDVIVSAGNVMAFLAPSTRVRVLGRLRAHLAGDGRAVIGFGAGRDYAFSQFFDDVAEAGLAPDLLLSTWDLRPFTDGSDFLVALLREA